MVKDAETKKKKKMKQKKKTELRQKMFLFITFFSVFFFSFSFFCHTSFVCCSRFHRGWAFCHRRSLHCRALLFVFHFTIFIRHFFSSAHLCCCCYWDVCCSKSVADIVRWSFPPARKIELHAPCRYEHHSLLRKYHNVTARMHWISLNKSLSYAWIPFPRPHTLFAFLFRHFFHSQSSFSSHAFQWQCFVFHLVFIFWWHRDRSADTTTINGRQRSRRTKNDEKEFALIMEGIVIVSQGWPWSS